MLTFTLTDSDGRTSTALVPEELVYRRIQGMEKVIVDDLLRGLDTDEEDPKDAA